MTLALAIWAVIQRIGASALSFLGKLNIWQLLLIAALLIAGVQTVRVNRWKAVATHRQDQLNKCTAARHADQQAYAKAQADAQAANLAQIAKVKAEQERITGNVEQSYQGDLARLRAELGRLLHAAPQGAPGHPAAPDLPNAAPVADDPSRVSIPTDLYVHGAELELQLERLQQWVREQVAIDPNK